MLIVFGAIIFFLIYFWYRNYKKCDNVLEKILYIAFSIIIIIPILLYYMDRFNIATILKWNINVDTQLWLTNLSTYMATIMGAVVSSACLVFITMFQINRNNEDTRKRDAENMRLQNMPLIKYDCIRKNDEDIKLTSLDTHINNGAIQHINLSLKNIGLNTIRKSYIKIKSDILKKEYNFEIGDQSSIEKNEEKIIQFLLKLFVDATYKFELTIYYQDLLCNNYEQKVLLEYKLSSLHLENDYEYNYKLSVENEKIIDEIPTLVLDEL